MSKALPLVIAIAYFLVLSVGVSFFLRKKVKSGSDFVTGSGKLPWPLVVAAFVLAPRGSGHTLSLWQASADMGGRAGGGSGAVQKIERRGDRDGSLVRR